MTLEEFATLLSTLNYDVAKDEFPKDYNATHPYIIYEVLRTNNFIADDVVYAVNYEIAVSIYTSKRADETAQRALETLFNNNGIAWQFEGEYDHEEYDYEVVYTISLGAVA